MMDNLPDELLFKILRYLPYLSFHNCRLVSKRWSSLKDICIGCGEKMCPFFGFVLDSRLIWTRMISFHDPFNVYTRSHFLDFSTSYPAGVRSCYACLFQCYKCGFFYSEKNPIVIHIDKAKTFKCKRCALKNIKRVS